MWRLILQKDYFKAYLKRKIINFINHGIYRIEARGFLNGIFDEDGKPLSVDDEYAIF